jgi:hypothetical protein
MLALSLGLLMVMMATAVLLADMERKRRAVVELLDALTPLIGRTRRLTMANLRRLSHSPVHAYSLLEGENGVAPSQSDTRRISLFAGSRLANLQERLQVITAIVGSASDARVVAIEPTATPSAEPDPASVPSSRESS